MQIKTCKYDNRKVRFGICDKCDKEVNCDSPDRYDTIDCENCGQLYNSSGQQLRPRSEWEEVLEPEDY